MDGWMIVNRWPYGSVNKMENLFKQKKYIRILYKSQMNKAIVSLMDGLALNRTSQHWQEWIHQFHFHFNWNTKRNCIYHQTDLNLNCLRTTNKWMNGKKIWNWHRERNQIESTILWARWRIADLNPGIYGNKNLCKAKIPTINLWYH